MGTMGLAPVAGARAQMVAAATLAAIGKTVAGTIGWQDEPRSEVLSWHTTKKDIFGGYCCWACESTNGLAALATENQNLQKKALETETRFAAATKEMAKLQEELKRKSALFGPRGWL